MIMLIVSIKTVHMVSATLTTILRDGAQSEAMTATMTHNPMKIPHHVTIEKPV